jgi:hypothetical protein
MPNVVSRSLPENTAQTLRPLDPIQSEAMVTLIRGLLAMPNDINCRILGRHNPEKEA